MTPITRLRTVCARGIGGVKNSERVKAYRKKRSASDEWKSYMKRWYSEHAEQTRNLSKQRNKKYLKKHVDAITEKYARRVIAAKIPGLKQVDIPIKIVKAKQLILTIKREVSNGTNL